jgi:hypothetical protein
MGVMKDEFARKYSLALMRKKKNAKTAREGRRRRRRREKRTNWKQK